MLSKYMEAHEGEIFEYIGTVWGSTPCRMTGKEIADFLKETGYDSGEYLITNDQVAKTGRNAEIILKRVIDDTPSVG